MLWNRRYLAFLTVALLVAAFQCVPARGDVDTAARVRQFQEVKRRVKQIDAAISELAASAESAGQEMNVRQVPGREAFIAWALSMIATLEEEGTIIRDDDFVRAAGEDRKDIHGNSFPCGQRDSIMLFETLGRLRAKEAIPVLGQYVITWGLQDMMASDRIIGKMFPACGALAAIGEASLPAMAMQLFFCKFCSVR